LEELVYIKKPSAISKYIEVGIPYHDIISERFQLVRPEVERSAFSRSKDKLIANLCKLSTYKKLKGFSFVEVMDGSDYKRKSLRINIIELKRWSERVYDIYLSQHLNKTHANSIKAIYPSYKSFGATPLALIEHTLLRYDKYSFPKQRQFLDKVAEFLFGAILQKINLNKMGEAHKSRLMKEHLQKLKEIREWNSKQSTQRTKIKTKS